MSKWQWGDLYKVWYLDHMDIERCCGVVALDEEIAMDIFQHFDKHKGLQIIACDKE